MTLETITEPLPGKGDTRCNRTACQTPLRPGRRLWNTSTQAWYCHCCARRINETSPGLCVPEADKYRADAAAPKQPRLSPMEALYRLERRCRFQPKMGGNTETITLPCSLVARLAGLATTYRAINPDNLTQVLASLEQEATWAGEEAATWLTKT